MDLAVYDEVYVVSDLHMGGETGFQILRDRECKRLAGFIDWLAKRRPDHKIVLVLNGDVIDTLAEKDSDYLAVDNAQAVVLRIMDDPNFSLIWKALANLAQTANRTLIFVLGNHDLEISFPVVQHTIVERLTGGNAAARGRIEFSTMGAGYTCKVNGRRVFITHGNEVDGWNYVRYEDLARVCRRINSGRPLRSGDWEPNAGAMMVKLIMNEIKRTYRWIDLLKPEVKAALGTLVAIAPAQAEKLRHILPVIGERAVGAVEVNRRLSAEGFAAPSTEQPHPITLDRLLGPNLLAGVRQTQGDKSRVDEMLLRAENNFETFKPTSDSLDQPLGTWQYIKDRLTGWITGVGEAEALRRALLDWLDRDPSFDTSDRDQTCKDVIASIGAGIDFVITGHTHLERALDLPGGLFYFNCGTWIRLLRITKEMLTDEKTFAPVYEVLKKGTMQAIDNAAFGGKPFVLDQSGAVRIKGEGSATVGELLHILDDGEEQKVIKRFSKD